MKTRPRIVIGHRATPVLVLLLAGFMPGCGSDAGPPIFGADVAAFNLGVREAGETDFEVPFTNAGGSDLAIDQVKSSCVCTVASATPVVRPGGRGVIKARASIRSGPGSAQLMVIDNEQGGGREFKVSWFGKGIPTLSTTTITLLHRPREVVESEFEITYPGGDPRSLLVIDTIVGLPEGCSIDILENDPSTIQANPILSPINVAGRVKPRLRAKSTHATKEETIHVAIKVSQRGIAYKLPLLVVMRSRGGITAKPDRLLFSASDYEGLEAIERRVLLTSDADGDDFVVVARPSFLDAEIRPSGRFGLLTVHFRSRPKSGVSREVLTIKNARGETIDVPITVSMASD